MSISTIRELRSNQNLSGAIDELIRSCRDQDKETRTAALREFVYGARCLVLEWAMLQFANDRQRSCMERLQKLREFVLPKLGAKKQFAARLNLIEAAGSYGTSTTTIKRLRGAVLNTITEVQAAWNYNSCDHVAKREAAQFTSPRDPLRTGPSFLQHLQDDAVVHMFQEIASDLGYGWSHPGLLLAGETLAALGGQYHRADHSTSTWVMFAAIDESKQASAGILARLTLERLPGSGESRSGYLAPDPLGAGYLFMQHSFSVGLQHAWLAACTVDALNQKCDWRWRIDVEESTRFKPFSEKETVQMYGSSAEGAFTCAMIAVANGDYLDRYTCMSARLTLDEEGGVGNTLNLDIVRDLDKKTLSDRLRVKKIQHIIISDKTSDVDRDFGLDLNIVPTRSVETALTEFCVWPVITMAVRARIHELAIEERAALCGEPIPTEFEAERGVDFVQPPIGLRDLGRAENPELPNQQELLGGSELTQFQHGRYRPPGLPENAPVRLQLFADSGMGKTVQLLICEQTISGDKTQNIPIRLGKRACVKSLRNVRAERGLDTIQWGGLLEDNLKQLAELVQPYIPDEHKGRSLEWVKRVASQGQFVFLLDALDQQRSELTHLATFLAKDEISQCTTIVTGRPESLTTRSEVFEGQSWQRLELLKLGEQEQRRYLGSRAAKQLIPERETPYHWDRLEEHRRHQWKDLLETPLLLSMMKELATPDDDGVSKLQKIPNRFSLYQQHAASLLFRKGRKSVDKGSQDEANEVECLLKDIAVHMVRQHNFEALEGDEFDDWKTSTKIGEKQLRRIVQIDVVKEHAFLDRIEFDDAGDGPAMIRRGIEWRHRSLLEYYAACALADIWRKDRKEGCKILRDVHQCLDDNGKFRLWKIKTQSDGRREVFRNLPADWQWTLRFLLAAVDEPHRSEVALELISLGNASVVARSMLFDRVDLERKDLDILCKWLVRRIATTSVNFEATLQMVSETERISVSDASNALANLLQDRPLFAKELLALSTRDPATLSCLRELKPRKVTTSWRQMTADHGCFLDEQLAPAVWRTVSETGTQLSIQPVTQGVFEAFCPSQRRRTSGSGVGNQIPVSYVTWHIAVEFCYWLTEVVNDGFVYQVPSEQDWRALFKHGVPKNGDEWWEWVVDVSDPQDHPGDLNSYRCLVGGSLYVRTGFTRRAVTSQQNPRHMSSHIGFRLSRRKR